jgi:hypothetical protein
MGVLVGKSLDTRPFEDVVVVGRTILIIMNRMSVIWIHLAWDRNKWWDLVNKVMNLQDA